MVIINLTADQEKLIAESQEPVFIKDQAGAYFGTISRLPEECVFSPEQIAAAIEASKSSEPRHSLSDFLKKLESGDWGK